MKEEMMRQRTIWQKKLFDESHAVPRPLLREEEQREVTRLLVELMQALAKTIDPEANNEDQC
jgi:hypothetical protein